MTNTGTVVLTAVPLSLPPGLRSLASDLVGRQPAEVLS